MSMQESETGRSFWRGRFLTERPMDTKAPDLRSHHLRTAVSLVKYEANSPITIYPRTNEERHWLQFLLLYSSRFPTRDLCPRKEGRLMSKSPMEETSE